jgi:hypothetical protein
MIGVAIYPSCCVFCRPMNKIALMSCLVFFFVACGAEIGDECGNDNDCSPNGDRNCDDSEPGGYCLIIGCSAGECPGEASCVEFTTPCPENMDAEMCEMIEPNRGRTYCMKHCKKNGDCRSGYDCIAPEELSASIIDLNSNQHKICVPKSDSGGNSDSDSDSNSDI